MKILSRGRSIALGLALIAAGLATPTALGTASAAAPQPDPNLVSEMRQDARGKVALSANPATGEVGFVRATGKQGDLLPDVDASGRAGATKKVAAYFDEYAEAFGAPSAELEPADVFADDYGWSVSYTQTHDGLPVFGAELKAHVDKSGKLTSVNGYVAPDLDVATKPSVTQQQAADRALAMVKERPAGYEDALPDAVVDGLKVRSNDLMIYRMGSTRGIDGEAKLAWVLEVWNESTIRETVIIDAQTGKYLNRWSMMAHALDRELIEAYDGAQEPETVWVEGDEFPGALDEDQQNEVLGTSESYWMFQNTFGYDSWDGNGAKMITVNNDPAINCPNANWNGVSTNYCTGVTGDDTVAHEWGHAYTETTSGLIYQWQSGAMNEAYSDIWGETVDMLNDRHNEGGETEADPVLREPDRCSIHQVAPYDMNVSITAPESIAGDCSAAAGFGAEIPQEPITSEVVVGVDAQDEAGPSATDGCSPFENADAIADKWVYVDRGTCTYQVKVDNAEAAGALGMVVGNNTRGLQGMAGETDIYTVAVTQADGTRIKSVDVAEDGPVTMTFQKDETRFTDDTYRWLSGESDPAFGGAIRDMWNPTCYGDPGQVSDAEYHCTEDDSGGVHTNSGVVNRAFAILVDGYQPGGVEAIGLDKAANLFWHTQTNHLVPTSDFPALADGLEASCATLTGQDINQVTLGDPSEADGSDGEATPELADPITEADCAALTAAIAETELRMEPEQCNFQPLLEKGELSCGPGTETTTTWSEDFEDGLADWTADVEFFEHPAYGSGNVSHPWETTTDLPETNDVPGGDRPDSTVVWSADPTTGSCAGDENDESSRDGLISPAIEVPEGASPRLSFDHLVATEAGWDGGNVKYSTDGGETFEEIPANAWIFNGPQGDINTLAEGNTNPLAGQKGFTGTDGGVVFGSWGTSYVNLLKLGLHQGDTVHFRFDMGRDGCNGVDGWYVDDVQVTVCEEKAEEPTPQKTSTNVTKVAPKKVKKGKPFRVKVKVTADEKPKGLVQIRKGKRVLGKARLRPNGVVVIKARARMRPGKHTLVARYVGNDAFKPSKDRFRIKVVKRRR